MTNLAPTERAALADLMERVGPDAPTLCAGWDTRDLAAHLVVRGSRPDAALGILVPAFAGRTRRVQQSVAAQPWSSLLAKVRRRPSWAVVGDELVNGVEYFVHHEDVRRAQPGWEPRALPADADDALWSRVRMQGRLALRRTPARVSLVAPGREPVLAGSGGPAVELQGPPSEVLLFLLGRQAQARVELTGPSAITDRMRTAHYGI